MILYPVRSNLYMQSADVTPRQSSEERSNPKYIEVVTPVQSSALLELLPQTDCSTPARAHRRHNRRVRPIVGIQGQISAYRVVPYQVVPRSKNIAVLRSGFSRIRPTEPEEAVLYGQSTRRK
jgi:hypothetical protein